MVEITRDKLEEHINVFMTELTAGSSAAWIGFDDPDKVFFFRGNNIYKVVIVYDRMYKEGDSRFAMIIEKTITNKKVEYKYYQISSVYEYKQQVKKENNWEAFALSDHDYDKIDKLPVSWIWEKYDKKTLERDLKVKIYPDLLNNLNTPVLLDKGFRPITNCSDCPHGQYEEWLDGLRCNKSKDGYYGRRIPEESIVYKHERPRWCPLTRTIENGKKDYLELGEGLGYVKDGKLRSNNNV
jgi:hypothetical protein